MAIDELYPNPIEMLQDGHWHWLPRAKETFEADVPQPLWVHGAPAEPGHYPDQEAEGYMLTYYPEAEITFLGDDVYATNGYAEALGRSVLATIVPWPAPDFMGSDKKDGYLFIKLWGTKELQAGHIHLPLFFALEEGTIRGIAAERAKRNTSLRAGSNLGRIT